MSTLTELEEELWICNWFYSLGSPAISDLKYNRYFEKLRKEKPDSILITKTWSELGKPTELLVKHGLLESANKLEDSIKQDSDWDGGSFLPPENMERREKYLREVIEYFDMFVPKSIDTIEEVVDAYTWYNTIAEPYGQLEYCAMLKADGFNIGLLYVDGYFVYAGTRGRSGSSEDVTIAMSKVVPLKIKAVERFVRIKGEAVMAKDALTELRIMDPTREWKSTRSSIRTLLMPSLSTDFHKKIIFLAFKLEGHDFESFKEEFTFLSLNKFRVVDYRMFTAKSGGEVLDMVRQMSEIEAEYNSDGCVMAVNSHSIYNQHDTAGKYDFCMRAFRTHSWKSGIYCSLITDFGYEYSSKNISFGLKIIPTKVSNGSEITNLDADNPARLNNTGVKRGSVVAFHMRSDSCVDWLTMETVQIRRYLEGAGELPERLKIPLEQMNQRLGIGKESINEDGSVKVGD